MATIAEIPQKGLRRFLFFPIYTSITYVFHIDINISPSSYLLILPYIAIILVKLKKYKSRSVIKHKI